MKKTAFALLLTAALAFSMGACNTSAFATVDELGSTVTAAAESNSGVLEMAAISEETFLPEQESDADAELAGPYMNIPVVCPEEFCFGMQVKNDGTDNLNVDVGGEIFKVAAQTEVWIYSAEPYRPDAGARSTVRDEGATIIGFSTRAAGELDGTMQIWLFDSPEEIPVPAAQP
ncbi:MAG TPA: hypothetical protein H9915_01055 [Candidatus Gemmiger faecigallinarum]|nr:hypothetical protein [Candidatus Gemmiger faecigallinarum]